MREVSFNVCSNVGLRYLKMLPPFITKKAVLPFHNGLNLKPISTQASTLDPVRCLSSSTMRQSSLNRSIKCWEACTKPELLKKTCAYSRGMFRILSQVYQA